jgi:hypothetical protein
LDLAQEDGNEVRDTVEDLVGAFDTIFIFNGLSHVVLIGGLAERIILDSEVCFKGTEVRVINEARVELTVAASGDLDSLLASNVASAPPSIRVSGKAKRALIGHIPSHCDTLLWGGRRLVIPDDPGTVVLFGNSRDRVTLLNVS